MKKEQKLKQVSVDQWMTEWMDGSREERRRRADSPSPSPLQLYSTVDGRKSAHAHRPSPSEGVQHAQHAPLDPPSLAYQRRTLFTVQARRSATCHCKVSVPWCGWDGARQRQRQRSDRGGVGVALHNVPSPRKNGGSAKMAQGLVDKECTPSSRLPETDTETEV